MGEKSCPKWVKLTKNCPRGVKLTTKIHPTINISTFYAVLPTRIVTSQCDRTKGHSRVFLIESAYVAIGATYILRQLGKCHLGERNVLLLEHVGPFLIN